MSIQKRILEDSSHNVQKINPSLYSPEKIITSSKPANLKPKKVLVEAKKHRSKVY
jgi:hypothetical protein